MSSVLKALEESEQQRNLQAEHLQADYSKPELSQPQRRSYAGLYLAILLIPAGVTGVFSLHNSYQITLADLQANLGPKEVVVEQPVKYQQMPAPIFQNLQSTRSVQSTPDVSHPQAQYIDENSPLPVTETPPPTVYEAPPPTDLSSLDLSGLSSELAHQVEQAISAIDSDDTNQPVEGKHEVELEASNLSKESGRWIGVLPPLNFQTHVYSSRDDKRWVKVNGVEFSQGDAINEEILLLKIAPQSCLIRFRGELIQIPALYDWKG